MWFYELKFLKRCRTKLELDFIQEVAMAFSKFIRNSNAPPGKYLFKNNSNKNFPIHRYFFKNIIHSNECLHLVWVRRDACSHLKGFPILLSAEFQANWTVQSVNQIVNVKSNFSSIFCRIIFFNQVAAPCRKIKMIYRANLKPHNFKFEMNIRYI